MNSKVPEDVIRLLFSGKQHVSLLRACTVKVLLSLCWLLLLSVALPENVYGQQMFKTTEASVIGYLEYLPQGYEENSDKYPVVIFLHGIGERGVNTTDSAILRESVQKVAALGPPSYVKSGTEFPFILISPQLKNNYGHWPSAYVMEVIDHIKTYLRIDEKRIYLTGLSLGGGGAWWTAQDYPELFAALAPVCGGRNTPSKACAIAAENLPVWAFHGDKDTIVPMSKSVNMVHAINDCKPAPSPAARMTIYPGVAHNAWTNAYRTDHVVHEPNVYEWMLSFTNTINRGNELPFANAGNDQGTSETRIHIPGYGGDADGLISSYAWKQISGPSPAQLTGHTTSTLLASELKKGIYVFSLQVTDNDGDTDTDYVQIKVENAPLPEINAGEDMLVVLPENSIALKGYPNDSEKFSYRWIQTAGKRCTVMDATSATLSVLDLVSGEYSFRLTVTDRSGNADTDEVTVWVTFPPAVEGGPDVSVPLTTSEVTLTGSAYDPDGEIQTYTWKKFSGPDVVLKDEHLPTAKITDLKEGTYVFVLTATDNFNAASSDHVTINVKKEILATDLTYPVSDKRTERLDVPDHESFHPAGESTPTVFGSLTSLDLEDCLITIFNDAGQRIFSGLWSAETYRSIFGRNGLYLYQIMKNGNRIDTGKIYIRRR
ncbi:MAG: PHB depolymerase family esterase [Chryseosolibacter sp.]